MGRQRTPCIPENTYLLLKETYGKDDVSETSQKLLFLIAKKSPSWNCHFRPTHKSTHLLKETYGKYAVFEMSQIL